MSCVAATGAFTKIGYCSVITHNTLTNVIYARNNDNNNNNNTQRHDTN